MPIDRWSKRISYIACFYIPIELLSFGFFGFSFTGHESAWIWSFIKFASLYQVGAILLSLKYPRLGALWLVCNVTVSLLVAHHVETCKCVTSSVIAHVTLSGAVGSAGSLVRLYGFELLIAACLLVADYIDRRRIHAPID
jgi:hypothetical protein